MPPDKTKITTIIFETNLKQALLTRSQKDGHFPGAYSEFSENGTKLHKAEACDGKPHKVRYFLPLSNRGQAYILIYFTPMSLLPTCDQVHSVHMWSSTFCAAGQSILRIEVESCGSLSCINNISQHSRKWPVLEQAGLTG